MSKKRRRLPPAFAATCAHAVYRLLCATLRFREKDRPVVDELDAKGEHMVFSLWHDELFSLMPMQKQLDIVTVVSPSRDGEFLARVLEKLGLRTVRGSSTRGGASALLGAAKLMQQPRIHACVTVDGPKGPRHRAKDGVFFLADHANAWVVPVRVVPRHSYKARTWDRFQIPWPFTRVRVLFGAPWKVEGAHGDYSAARARLEADLEALCPDPPFCGGM